MQVHYDEGVANHIGPEPCAGIREDVGEASAGERAGQPLSRDRKLIPGADAVCVAEGNMSKTRPPVNVFRKASLSSRMRATELALLDMIAPIAIRCRSRTNDRVNLLHIFALVW